jgi:hypothetical protein
MSGLKFRQAKRAERPSGLPGQQDKQISRPGKHEGLAAGKSCRAVSQAIQQAWKASRAAGQHGWKARREGRPSGK